MLSLLYVSGHAFAQDSLKPNIIFLIVDDLNDYTTALGGHPQTVTPNIERLESWGTTFTNVHCSSPKCAPSRTSFITGKDLAYTQVYNNLACKPFRDYFDADEGNEEVYTMPEYFKDQGGYYTYGINKINHCFDTYFDYDSVTADPCAKELSWSQYSLFHDGEDSLVRTFGNEHNHGTVGMAWAPVPDSMETYMYDHRAVDSASRFFSAYTSGELDACGKPFFMYVGFRKPHEPFFIPEKYFEPYYCLDYYPEPLDLPYNSPPGAFPYNGFVMPPQPDTLYQDFYNLPEGGLAQYMAAFDSLYFDLYVEVDELDTLPYIADGLSDAERREIMHQVFSANLAMAYQASVKYLDAQVGRLLDSLEAYPELFSNTIIVLASDHGFSLGEKRHWEKGALWETDQRVPLVISDLRAPVAQTVPVAVSLLDVFPTLCAMTETPLPAFADGSAYLDGQSLGHLLENPALMMERPAISAYRERNSAQLSCRPQYSLRNDRFHYILYTSNGPEGSLDCDPVDYYIEEELYEIGIERNVDPNEWHNLAYDPDYAPVIEYLQQWLPDSALYLQKNFIARIRQTTDECLPDTSDVLVLQFDMYDESGNDIAPPDSFIYSWTNNLTDTTLYGITASFPIGALPDSVYAETDEMLWYLHARNAAGIIRAFDLRNVHVNPTTKPHVAFSLERIDSLTVQVVDFVITGSYHDIRWDFGAGEIIEEDVPESYTYPDNGSYTITCMVYYGNSDDCIETESAIFSIISDENMEAGQLTVYPNPNNGLLSIATLEPFDWGHFFVYDMAGRMVYQEKMPAGPFYDHAIDLSHLPSGVYELLYVNTRTSLGARCVIVRNE